MNYPLVSIITPSYSQGHFLRETIESVLYQDYPNIEYIIIDGGSKDTSLEIIKKYQKHLKYWISEPDEGQADAINKGLIRSTGDYLCWLNSDDILYPEFISNRIEQFHLFPEADFIYGDVDQGPDCSNTRIRKGKQTNFTRMLKTLQVPIPQQSAIWKREVFERIGPLETKWDVLLDREYFLRIAQLFNIKYIPGTVAFFRNHQNSKSIASEEKWAREIPLLYEEIFYENKYDLKPVIQKRKKQYLIASYIMAENIARRSNNPNLSELLKNRSLTCSRRIYSLMLFRNFLLKNIKRPGNLFKGFL